MNKIYCLLILLCTALSVQGQVAEEAIFVNVNQRATCNGNMDAGTLGLIKPLQAESNSASLTPPFGAASEPIFLCYNDIIFIDHNGDGDLAGDPDPSSQGGIAYAFYDRGAPTVSGDEFQDLIDDDIVTTIDGTGIVVARGLPNGDVYFQNSGQVQNQFRGGSPVQMWFAPITLSDFEGGLIDANCVNVRADQAFSIVYLNQIQLFSFTTPPGSLSGSFTLRGGLPEYESGRSYSVTMVNTDDPSVLGTINESPSHDFPVTFDVPEAGNYLITVTDGMGCSYSVIRSIPSDVDPVGLCLADSTIDAGEQFCIPITVENYADILSFAFSIKWDPGVLDFDQVSNPHPTIAGSASFVTDRVNEGIFTTLWFELNLEAQTLPAGSTLFELCFTTSGDPGDRTSLVFSPTPTTDISITNETEEVPFETKNGSITITPPQSVDIFKEEICATSTGGIIVNFSVFGGTGPYTYQLSNTDLVTTVQTGDIQATGTTVTLPVLPSANYELKVTDANGMERAKPIFGSMLNVVSYDLTTSNPSCPESNDGYIKIENLMSNGNSNRYNWINLLTGEERFGSDSIGSLGTGKWRAIVTDANGCMEEVEDSVLVEDLVVDFSILGQPSCSDTEDGSLRATAQGGGLFEYRWFDENNMQLGNQSVSGTGSTRSGLADGIYFVEVTRPNSGCPALRDSQRLLPAKELILTVDPSTTEQVDCNGQTDGRIQLSASALINDLGQYNFDWSDLDGGTPLSSDVETTVTGLAPGSYQLVVSEAAGSMCAIDTTFEITEPAPLNVEAMVTLPSCPNGTDGSIDFGFFNGVGGTEFTRPDGGTRFPPYNVYWNGNGTDNRTQSTNLSDGDYVVTLEDANGCIDSTVFTLKSGPTIQIDGSLADLTCIGDETASLSVVGDIQGNEIIWSTGATTSEINNLGAGIYAVSVIQMQGDTACPSNDTFELMEPVIPVSITRDMRFDALSGCRDNPNGRIFNMEIRIGGPIDWRFTGPELDTSFRSSLPFLQIDTSGTYYYDVMNIDDCIVYQDSIVASFPEPIVVDIDTLAPSCFAQADGEVTLSLSRPSTGATQFSVDWSNGMSDTNIDVSSISALDSGTYIYTVMDVLDSACVLTDSITIDDPAPLEISVDSSESRLDLCFGENDGQIRITRTGGNNDGPPTIMWSHDNMLQGLLAEDLVANTYMVDFTDNRGCTDQAEILVSQLDEIEAFYDDPTEPDCFGGQTSIFVDDVIGGLPEYSFSVDNGPAQIIGSEIPLFAGEHVISIFDAAGCRLDDTIMIAQPEKLSIGLMDELTVGLGESVTLDADLGGLVQIDTFIWTPEELLSCTNCPDPSASLIDDQLFQLRVVDLNGCEAEGQVMVRVDKARGIYIPNAFSPDGDGRNDTWQVFSGASVRQILSTMIVDRWGNVVYHNNEPEPPSATGTQGWNGKMGEEDLDPAVYLYLVEVQFVDGLEVIYRGDINLIR